jgi:hypothetical protein
MRRPVRKGRRWKLRLSRHSAQETLEKTFKEGLGNSTKKAKDFEKH